MDGGSHIEETRESNDKKDPRELNVRIEDYNDLGGSTYAALHDRVLKSVKETTEIDIVLILAGFNDT